MRTKLDRNSFTEIKSVRQVCGISEDNTGNIWFGTDNGIYYFDGKSVKEFR